MRMMVSVLMMELIEIKLTAETLTKEWMMLMVMVRMVKMTMSILA